MNGAQWANKWFSNWFNCCDNLYIIKKLNDYFHMLKAFKWHCDWGSCNCTQNTFLWHPCVHMFMVVYVQHLIFIEPNIKWIVQIFGEIMINTKWGPKPNGNKFIYTKNIIPKDMWTLVWMRIPTSLCALPSG
jgi:hypothetical protein